MLIRFILNDKEIVTDEPPGLPLLDFIRYHQHLAGTKIGCREGDCGACTILSGKLENGRLRYTSATSCLMALGNAHGKHIITVEGLNMEILNPVQQAMSDEGATQCGFCTPGFVVSLAGFCLSENEPSYTNAIASVNGNICRCTGYKSIERAAQRVTDLMQERKDQDPVSFVSDRNILPVYLTSIPGRLAIIKESIETLNGGEGKFLGGGTDLYVQQHEDMIHAGINFLYDRSGLKGITQKGDVCIMGAAVTVTDILESPVFIRHFPNLQKYIKLVSSVPIRNMATVAGNFMNASPIGDLTIFFLALDAQLQFREGKNIREIPLRKLYKGYKLLDKLPSEVLENISFRLPPKVGFFNFEKVSKRTHLDIASANTAILLILKDNLIESCSISAGGVGPVPMFLEKTSSFLTGKPIIDDVIETAIAEAQSEISPISDARGSEEYKRLLLSQLIRVHFNLTNASMAAY